jgi:hypothetical protein
MEDVLVVYHRPHDPDRSVIGLDETSKQLVAERARPHAPGHKRPAATTLLGLAERRTMMSDRRLTDPVKFAHVRQELEIEPPVTPADAGT